MQKKGDGGKEALLHYKLWDTKRASTIQKEVQQLAVEGFGCCASLGLQRCRTASAPVSGTGRPRKRTIPGR